jgi:hypothetical protein
MATWSQFHQHFYERICANILVQIKSLTFTASKKKLCAQLLVEKGAHKMLVKLTPDFFKFTSKCFK